MIGESSPGEGNPGRDRAGKLTLRGPSGGPRAAAPRAVSPAGQRFWINTVSLDHVEAAIEGGFTQADHGAATRIGRPSPCDEMIFYSPRTDLWGGSPVRQFTAWATITGDQPYQAFVTENFRPWRLAATFHPCRRVDAKPLVTQLSFITDPAHWGLPFRRGLFTIPPSDFETIAAAMCGRDTGIHTDSSVPSATTPAR